MNFEILVATNNQHKLKEIRSILSPHKITVYGMNDLNIQIGEIEENGETYFENALIKAETLQKITTMPIIADDSGLEILSMNNKPGIYSSRYAESFLNKYEDAFKDINKQIEGKDRSAKFICDIVLLNVEEKPLLFEGVVPGKIANNPVGQNGFGYDPIFICDELNKCYALLTEEEKNKVSHRAKALKKLLTYLKINGLAI